MVVSWLRDEKGAAPAAEQSDRIPDARGSELLHGRRILFVMGSYPGKRTFYEHVRALGVRMSVLDGPGHWSLSAPNLFEHAITVDLAEPAAVLGRALEAIAATGLQFDAVATFEEAAGPLTAGIAQHLGLPGHPLQAIEAVRHKDIARRVCHEAGIPTPRFALIRSAGDLEPAAANVGFPAVLKPASGMASFAVYRVDSRAELWERYTQTQAAVGKAWEHELTSDNEAALVWAEGVAMVLEEYLDGEEFDVDCLMSAGELVYARPVRDLPQPHMVETGSQLPPNYPEERLAALVALTCRVLAAIGFRDGAFHVELKDTSRGPRLIEVNARIGGGPAWELHQAVWGVNLIEQYLLIQLGVSVQPEPAPEPRGYYLTADLPATHTGTVTRVDFLDHLAAHPKVVRATPKVVVGQQVVGPDTGVPEWMGEIVVCGESVAEAEAVMARILATIELPVAVVYATTTDR